MIDVDDRTSDLVRINERMNEMTPKRNKCVQLFNHSSECILNLCKIKSSL